MAAVGVDPHPENHDMQLRAPSRSYRGVPEDQAEGAWSGVHSGRVS